MLNLFIRRILTITQVPSPFSSHPQIHKNTHSVPSFLSLKNAIFACPAPLMCDSCVLHFLVLLRLDWSHGCFLQPPVHPLRRSSETERKWIQHKVCRPRKCKADVSRNAREPESFICVGGMKLKGPKLLEKDKRRWEVSNFRLVNKAMCVCVQATDNEVECEYSVFTLINYINTVRQLFRLWSSRRGCQKVCKTDPSITAISFYANLIPKNKGAAKRLINFLAVK